MRTILMVYKYKCKRKRIIYIKTVIGFIFYPSHLFRLLEINIRKKYSIFN